MKYVYLVRAGKKEYKVGVAVNINKRIKGIQTGNAKKIELITAKQTPDAYAVERAIHKLLEKYKHNGGREWFSLSAAKVVDICVLINHSPGITVTEIEVMRSIIDEQKELLNLQESKQQDLLARADSILEQAKSELEPKVIIKHDNGRQQEIANLRAKRVMDKEQSEALELEQAIAIVRQYNKASTSMLQRHMKIGYGRAARIIDKLEQRGFISEADGSSPRIVFAINGTTFE